MQTQKNYNDSSISKATPRAVWEQDKSEKKAYLKRKAEEQEQAELIEEWLKFKEDNGN